MVVMDKYERSEVNKNDVKKMERDIIITTENQTIQLQLPLQNEKCIKSSDKKQKIVEYHPKSKVQTRKIIYNEKQVNINLNLSNKNKNNYNYQNEKIYI